MTPTERPFSEAVLAWNMQLIIGDYHRRDHMKRIHLIALFAIPVLLLPTAGWSNGLFINSIGARAMAMGGAFVGLADDLSAVYWNPAGISLIETTTFGFTPTHYSYSTHYDWNSRGISADDLADSAFKGLAAVVFPIKEGWTGGFALYSPLDFRTEWPGVQIGEIFDDASQRMRKNTINSWTVAAASAWRINKKLSLGAALELHYGRFDNQRYQGYMETGAEPYRRIIFIESLVEKSKGIGLSGTLGLLYRSSDKLSLGLALKIPGNIWLKGQGSSSNHYDLDWVSVLRRNLTLPFGIRGGVSFKPVPTLTLTADIHYTLWSMLDTITDRYADPLWDMLFVTSESDIKVLNWKDTLQLRVGMEYRIGSTELRLGFYTDPAASPDSTTNLMFHDISQNYITAGLGVDGKTIRLYGVHIDVGFEYGFEGSREISEDSVLTDPAFEHAVPGTYRRQSMGIAFAFSYRF